MFDTMLNVLSVTTSGPSEDDVANGADPHIVVSVLTGMALPLADPANPGQPLVVPGGQVRFRLDGDAAVAIGTKLAEQGAALPKRPRIEIAQSLAGAEQAAERIASLRG